MKLCTGCGTSLTLDDIRARHPDALSCCPERDMVEAPAVGHAVCYRSIAGETWDAVVAAPPRTLLGAVLVDVDIFFPGGEKSMHTLKGVRWHDDPSDPLPGARPKASA